MLLAVATLFSACVGDDVVDDFVQPRLQLRSFPDTLEAGTSFQLTYQFFNNVGLPEDVTPTWSSSDENILTVSASGLATGITEGAAEVTASFVDAFNNEAIVMEVINVGASTVVVEEPEMKSGKIAPTSFYTLTGDFTLTEGDGKLDLVFAENYDADRSLPGLYIYLSNNPRSINGALELGVVRTFSGAHAYEIPDVDINDFAYVLYFCKPFNVEVGNGAIE